MTAITTLLRASCLGLMAVVLLPSGVSAGEVLFESEAVARGDAAGALEEMLSAIEADPTDSRVSLLMVEINQLQPMVTKGDEKVRERVKALLPAVENHWNRDILLATLARLELQRGDHDAAAEYERRRGGLTAFLVTGPFGLLQNASLEEVFAPEEALSEAAVDPRQRFETRRGERGWHVLKKHRLRSLIRLNEVLWGRGAVRYAVTHVRSDRDVKGFLLYRGASTKLWVNRALVTVVDRARERLPHTLRIPVTLRAGWNRVVLKLAGSSFAIRLVGQEGGPLPVTCVAAPQTVPVGQAKVGPPQPTFVLGDLAKAREPQRRGLLVHVLLQNGLGQEAWTAVQDAQQDHPELSKAGWFQLLSGIVAQQADHLPAPVRRDRARQAFERALAIEPKSVEARRQLAEFAYQDDRVTEAVVMLESILKDYPAHFPTWLAIFSAVLSQGWHLEAERALESIAKHGGAELLPSLQARVRLHVARGHVEAAQKVREKVLALDRSQTGVVLQRIDLALARGDTRTALASVKEYGRLAARSASELAPLVARVRRAAGQHIAAQRALAPWVAAKPADVSRKLTLARQLSERPDDPRARAAAAALLEGILAAAPGQHSARTLLQGLRAKEDRFWEEWAPDVRKILRDSPRSSTWPRANSVCLFDQAVLKVYPDTSTVNVVHQFWRVLNEQGIKRYGARRKLGQLLEVRTHTAAGEVLEPIRTGTQSFEMPGLTPGAVVEHAWKSEHSGALFQFSDGPFFFMDPDLTEPFWFSRWVLMIHEDAPVTIVVRNMKRRGITKTTQRRGPWRIHIYTARNQPRVEPEPGMPHRTEILPWVKVVEKRSLDEIGAFYQEQAIAGRRVPPSVMRKAAELVEGAKDDAARVRRLWDFVQKHVSEPIELGSVARSWSRHRPERVLASRKGGKTILLAAMLTAAKVPHQIALAGSNPYTARRPDWNDLDPGLFRIPLIRIAPRGGQPFYVFAAAHRLAPYGHIPFFLGGAPVWVCDPKGGFLDGLPPGRFSEEARRTELRLQLRKGGSAVGRLREIIPIYEPKEQIGNAPMAALRSFFARRANGLFPGCRLVKFETPKLDEVGAPLTWNLDLMVPRAVRPRGDGTLEIKGVLSPAGLKRRFGSYRHRAFDLVLTEPTVQWDRVRIDLGPYACPRLPRRVRINHDFGQFSLVFAREGANRIRVERRIVLRPGRVTPKTYKRFRRFLSEMEDLERTSLVVEPVK